MRLKGRYIGVGIVGDSVVVVFSGDGGVKGMGSGSASVVMGMEIGVG